ncbi:hypothetical protein CHI_60 [Chivirus chi]|uniref:Uncharacterized protein n=2 Tax=Chivirus chi TaxID=1541887 RepID=M9NVC1_9CAUD|nr:hypothetical protein chi_025 [Salmonella phage Chi]YP_009101155.1 hypothetical protein CHI_60 [Chivirus chi]AFO71170.1 hypothetical protein chi_025 [Salmonella phage Chi]AIU37989.1 hypothetical protein CHI_60 [Chivirus chi]
MQPTNTALMVNNAMHPRGRIDVVPAFRAIERIYTVTIHATHTGIKVSSATNHRVTFYQSGDPAIAKHGKARGADECTAMRMYIIKFLDWAMTNMPCPEVQNVVVEVAGGKH